MEETKIIYFSESVRTRRLQVCIFKAIVSPYRTKLEKVCRSIVVDDVLVRCIKGELTPGQRDMDP